MERAGPEVRRPSNWSLPMPSFSRFLRDALRPIRARLLGNLERIFADAESDRRPAAERRQRRSRITPPATSPKLSELLTVATPDQFAVLYPIVAASPAPATVEQLGTIAATAPPLQMGSVERVTFGQRRANAAVDAAAAGRAGESSADL